MTQSSAGQDVGSTVKDLTHKRKALSAEEGSTRRENCRAHSEREEEDTRGSLLLWELLDLWRGVTVAAAWASLLILSVPTTTLPNPRMPHRPP